MRNWYEMEAFGRQRAAELVRLSESIRMEREAIRLARLQARAVEAAPALPKREPFPTEREMKHARATFVMERGEVLSIHAGRQPYRIGCVAGRLWATIDGSTVDNVLVPGQSLAYRGRGRVVIQALRTATVRIECPAATRVVLGSAFRPAFQLG
jgi:hypothetical protein